MISRFSLSTLALVVLSGCSALDNCPEGQAAIEITTGKSDPDAQSYESAAWRGELDAFPAKTALIFRHELGFTPLHVEPYLSFTKDGTHDADGGSVALSAGNQTLIDCVDSHVIVIRNDTCEKDFYIRVEAFGTALHDEGDSCHSSSD